MPGFVDSHAHLADPAFDGDREQVIERAREAGATAIICIGESIETARRAAVLAEANAGFIFATAGVHPHDAQQFDAERDIPAIRELCERGAVAVGECGLDYHYDHSPRDAQRTAFAAQIRLAKDLKRPVIVHTRDAEDDTRDMVVEAGHDGVRGVLHCYTGSHALAEAALDVGWYVSFAGIVTFRKWEGDAVIRLVPDDRILAESDAPYLAPVPHRGRRNEPAWVASTVERLAAARFTEADAMGRLTSENARRLFGLAAARPA